MYLTDGQAQLNAVQLSSVEADSQLILIIK